MSFFISENLKGVIGEEDLSLAEKTSLVDVKIKIDNSLFAITKLEKNKEDFLASISCDIQNFQQLLQTNEEIVSGSVKVDQKEYLMFKGCLKILSFEVNKEENCITCQILIDELR
tara:strand:+ start:205 stop:549 length:345 start_codon:yes stop_codon:yes gene_type:complete